MWKGWIIRRRATMRLAAATGLLIGCSVPDDRPRDAAVAPAAVGPPVTTQDPAPFIRRTNDPVVSERRAIESDAHASVQGTAGYPISGEIAFSARTDGLLAIEGEIVGLTPGKHGFHLHENGDCSAPDAASAGGHLAPDGNPHGAPTVAGGRHHAGDLGNIEANADGIARIEMTSEVLTMEGDRGVRGHAVVVHAQEDDLRSQPAGAAGERVACGLIVSAEPQRSG